MPHPSLVEQLQDTGFHFSSALHLHALLRSREVAEAAIRELLVAGFDPRDLHTWAGEGGAGLLERGAAARASLARTWRTAQGSTDEHQLLARFARAIRKGRVGLRIRCASPADVWRARQVLESYSARAMTHFDVGAIRTF
jgi:hypothetical protein